MKYFSTRNPDKQVSGAYAIAHGLAPDGGLYVPNTFPELSFEDLQKACEMNYRERAAFIMGMFLEDFSNKELTEYAGKAYSCNFRSDEIAPLSFLDENTAMLELFHGPTCAFKDMALQMLPYLLTASLKKTGEKREVCILVATSGDTGKAALDGFADVKGTRILVFYPRDGVSDVQKLQMVTQSGNNVCVSAVHGNFDDAQTGVKKIFNDEAFAAELDKRGFFLSSANSINWGRLLPQIVYYVSSYCDYVKSGRLKFGEKLNFCVPTGNFGNILAGWYAKSMGVPIGRLICASNENNVLTDFFKTGIYNKNREFYKTLSPSMDILVSSNLERLLYHVSGNGNEISEYMKTLVQTGKYEASQVLKEKLSQNFYSGCCNDADTKKQIAKVWSENSYLMDTHTAVAHKVLCDYRAETGDNTPTVVVSTASPYKFADSVLCAICGEQVDDSGVKQILKLEEVTKSCAPEPLRNLDDRKVRFTDCVDKDEMKSLIESFLK